MQTATPTAPTTTDTPVISTAVTGPEPLVVPAGSGHFIDLGDHRGLAKIGSIHSDGAFCLSEFHADFQACVPAHTHTREDETFYILDGRVEFTVDGKMTIAGPGDTVFAPRHHVHAWRCTSREGARVLLLITPSANFEAFAFEAAWRGYEPAAALANPTTRAEFLALCEEHGIHFEPDGFAATA